MRNNLITTCTATLLCFSIVSMALPEDLLIDCGIVVGDTVKPIGDDSFTIVLLPDTQHYVEEGKYSKNLECFESQIQWIIENKMKLNIVFVSHVGDIVQHHDIEDEFLRASNVMRKLDGVVPYGFCAGNHDMQLDLSLIHI